MSAQTAGRAFSAAPAPRMTMRVIAHIARMRFLQHEAHEVGAADFFGKRPRLRLGEPHQRSLDDERMIKPEAERYLQALHCVVSAVGIP